MKKTVSIILSALMLSSALFGCASDGNALDPAITLASSDAMEKAQWLDTRLDDIPDDVIIGIGTSETYRIDMSDFEADGYILRSMGDEVVIFGAGEDGLDRAVRKYAKAAEKGATADLDETYHEGKRVDKITVAGVDIADYAVTYPDGDKGNAKTAADEFARLINEACGVTIPVMEAAKASGYAHTVNIVIDDSLQELGSRYSIENGNITIAGGSNENSTTSLGCTNGVYMFLQQQIGWEDLIYGDSVLLENEHIDIPDDISVDNPTLADTFFFPYTQFASSSVYDNDRLPSLQNTYGRISQASHGMLTHNWSGADEAHNFFNQICYADENVYLNVFGNVLYHVENRLEAGQRIGVELNHIDIAQTDQFAYCKCSGCMKIIREEGGVHSGPVVRFANRLAEDMENAERGGLVYLIYAYHGSNIPCKTAPREDVYVTFCTDGHCSVHAINGGECFGKSFDMAGYWGDDVSLNNFDYSEWLRGWCEPSDNIYVWYYGLDNNLHQFTAIDQLYYDYSFFYECGVAGVFYQRPCSFLGLSRIELQLAAMMNADPDMTEEEYYAQVDRLLEKEYGEGWVYVNEVINIWEEAEMRCGHCGNCWGYGGKNFENQMDRDYFAGNFDHLVELLEEAIRLADTEDQEKRLGLLSVSLYYMGTAMQYFEAYDMGDVDRLEYLSDIYSRIVERIAAARSVVCYDMSISHIIGVDGVVNRIAEDITTEAWSFWVEMRDYLNPHSENPLPAPEDYVPPETAA